MKNLKYILPTLLLLALTFGACNKNNVEAPGSYTLPVPPSNSTLKAAGNASGLKVGVALSYADITNAERNAIIKSEFDNVTFDYNMKHGAIVQQNGSFDWTRSDALLAWARQNNLGIFGHALVWHQNQNASYLNLLAAPPVTDFFGPNLVVNSTFDTDLAGWAQLNPNPGGGCGVIHGRVTDEMHSGAGALRVGSCTAITADDYWRVQILCDLSSTMEAGGTFIVEFWIKSSVATTAQLETRESSGTDAQYQTFNTTTEWTKVSKEFTARGTENAIALDLNSAARATFHIDDVSVKQKFDGPPNLVRNPTFDVDLTGWAQLNPNPGGGCGVIHEQVTEVHSGAGALRVGSCAAITADDYWRVQIQGDLTAVMTADVDYVVEFWIKASTATTVQLETRESSGTNAQYKTFNATTDWSKITLIFKARGTENAIAFDLNSAAHATFHIDDVSVKQYVSDTSGDGPSEEDIAQIDNAMQTWISAIVERYKDDVSAWDVVNEPMADGNSGVRTSRNSDASGSDIFYWSDFLGRNYALKAFQYAAAADPNALLFINDYNLEINSAKLDSLIAYVNELKGKGAKIDGIGTQMHIADTRSYGAIREMFKKLAATGLLVKISELDIKATSGGATVFTDGQSQLQAAMYQYVIKTYLEEVPKAQQYGITIWGVEDASSWMNRPPDRLYFPLLWDDTFKRKLAYSAVYETISR